MGEPLLVTTTRTAHGAEGTVEVVETVAVHDATASLELACKVGLVAVAVLNVLDVVLTRWFLALGGAEGNPLMAGMAGSWGAPLVKAVIIGLLAVRFWRAPATAARLALVWAGVGAYAMAAYVNGSVVQHLLAR